MFRTLILIVSVMLAAIAPTAAEVVSPGGKAFIVDDFDGKRMFNLLGGKTQGYEEAGVRCIPTFTENPDERHGDTGASLRLDFDVSKGGDFSYYWSTLLALGDFRDYDFLSFWYRDPQGGAIFTIEIHQDTDGDGAYIMGIDKISSIDTGSYIDKLAAGKWQKIEIPLTRFSNIDDWSRVLDIVFVFKNGRGLNKGAVFIDDLSFVRYIGR
jgi:hypothetical protein